MPMTIISAGYASAAPTLPRSFDCDLHEVGEALEHPLERARRLARGDHVHVERREDLRVRLERLRERATFVEAVDAPA